MTRQFHHALQDLATAPGAGGAICSGNGMKARTCGGHALCGGATRLLWRRSDRLRLDLKRRYEMVHSFGEEQWVPDLGAVGGKPPKWGVLVLNRGAHFDGDDSYLTQMRATLTYLRVAHPTTAVVVRNTPPGHAACTKATGPWDRYRGGQRLPFHWHEFERQNAALRTLLYDEFPGVLYLDVEHATRLRPDLHLLGRRGKDCLHYRNPGPIDNWVRLFSNALQLAEDVAGGAGG